MSPIKDIKNRCSESVSGEGRFGAFHHHQCNRQGKAQRDRKWYCTQHDPVEKKRKYDERMAKWEAESLHRQRVWDRGALEHEYCENLSDDELRRRVKAKDLAK